MVTPLRRKLLRDIGRHRPQFVAIAITIFLGVMVFAASYDSFQNLKASYDQTFVDFRFANLFVRGGNTEAFAADAAGIPGVEVVQTRYVADLPLEISGVKLLGRVVGLPESGQPLVNQLKVIAGALPRGDGVVVEEHMARHFGLVVGDHVSLYDDAAWIQADVTGIVSSPEYIWPARDRQDIITSPDNFGVVFAVQSRAAAWTGLDAPNEAVLAYAGTSDDAAITAQLTDLAASHAALDVMPRELQPSNAALSEDIAGFEETALFFPLLFLAAAGMAAYVLIGRLVYAQRPYIGGLLANGFTRRQIAGHFLGYGLVPGLAGAIPGALAGIWLARVITRLYTGLLSVPVTLVQFYPTTVVIALVFGLGVSVVAALAPALVASRIHPAHVMRGESPKGRGGMSIIERIFPPARRLSTRWRMMLRNIGRNPRRTAYTIIGVVLSLMLVLVSWGMIDTVQHLLDRQFVQIQRQDATVYFTAPVDADAVSRLADVNGVAAAEPVFESPVSLSVAGRTYATSLVVMDPATTMHRFAAPSGDWVSLPGSGLLVGTTLESDFGARVGDPVSVTVGTANVTFMDTIAGFVDEPLGTIAYSSWENAAARAGVPIPVTSALIRYEPGVDPAAVRDGLTSLSTVAAFEDAKAMLNTVQDFMGLFYGFVGVMLVFGAAMSFALMFNTMSVNIVERAREIATLLAVGTERRAISRLVTIENLLVTGMGIPLGLVAGYYVSAAAMSSFASDMFRFDLYVRPTTFVLSALAMVIVALIAQIPGLRIVQRLRIPEIVKERSA